VRRALATAFALAVLAPALAAAKPAAERARFPVDVARPGLVTVELDAAALVRLGPGGGVEVLDPDGARVDAERHLASEEAACRAVAVGEVGREVDSWTVGLDLGDDPAPHAALVFELEEAVLASGCELESSADGRSWRPLARGDLFRLGEGRGLARTRLVYPPSRVPRLRLRWPAAAGYPRVRSVEVCAPEEASPAPTVGFAAEERAADGTRARWRLPLPPRAARVRALRMARAADANGGLGRLAWRLELAQDGAWHELAGGSWPAGDERLRVALGDVAFLGAALRVEVWGGTGPGPRFEWELAPQRVRFVAARAGRFALVLPAAPRPGSLSVPPGAGPVRAALGPAAVARADPARDGALGAAAPKRRFAARWRVEAPAGVAPGTPVVLEVPPLDGVAAAGRADARLVAAGRLVPARWATAAEPEEAVLASAAAPVPRAAGRSRLELDLAGRIGRPTALRLRAPLEAGAFRRGVALVGRVGPAPGAPEATMSRALWECAPDPPRPCETSFRLAGAAPGGIALEIEDGDAAPLRSLDAEVELAREEAVFLWPGTEVELLAGARDLEAPRFDFARLDEALALSPPVAVHARRALAAGGGLERWSRPLLVLAVAAVAIALLALLRRLLPGPGAPG
jgi:hypothetical protein